MLERGKKLGQRDKVVRRGRGGGGGGGEGRGGDC